MPKRNFLYLFMGGIIVIILTLVAVTIFTKPKPVKPPIAAQVTEKVPLVSQEPVLELEKKPVEVPVVPKVTPEAVIPVKEKAISKPEFQKGMTFIAWTEEGYSNPNSVKAMEQLASLGVEWACLPPTWYQYQYDSTKINPLRDRIPRCIFQHPKNYLLNAQINRCCLPVREKMFPEHVLHLLVKSVEKCPG